MKYYTKEWFRTSQDRDLPFPPRAYRSEYNKNFPNPPEFMKVIDSLHDCELISVTMQGHDLVIAVDAIEHGPLDSADIVLRNAVVLKQEPGDNLGWLHNEIYPVKNGYEFHVLFFQYGSGRLYELICECENVEIRSFKL